MIYLDCLDSLVVSASQVVLGPTFPIKQHSHYLWLDAPWLLDSNFFQTKCHLQSHRSHPPISMCKLEEFSFNHQCLYATICPSVRHNVHIGKLSTRNPLFLCTEACFLISNSAVRENSTSFIKTVLLWWFSSCFTAAFLTNTYWSHTQHAFWLVKKNSWTVEPFSPHNIYQFNPFVNSLSTLFLPQMIPWLNYGRDFWHIQSLNRSKCLPL